MLILSKLLRTGWVQGADFSDCRFLSKWFGSFLRLRFRRLHIPTSFFKQFQQVVSIGLLNNQTARQMRAIVLLRGYSSSPMNCARLASNELSFFVTHFWAGITWSERLIRHIIVILNHLAPYLFDVFLTFHIVLVFRRVDQAWLCLCVMTKDL